MPELPRLTIRCAIEDLELDHWKSDGPINGFPNTGDHEIVLRAAELFPTSRDMTHAPAKISVVKPTCYKIKTNRHRGAAYIDSDGQVWVVAAGIREDGSRKDFYQQFMNIDSQEWLPTDADKDLLERQQKCSVLRQWELLIWNTLQDSLPKTNWARGVAISVKHPFLKTETDVCTLRIEVVYVSGVPLGVEIRIDDYVNLQYDPLVRLAHRTAMSWVHRDEQAWSLTPLIASIEFGDNCTSTDLFSGTFRAQSPMEFRPGSVAHLVEHTAAVDIWDATVEGTPVQALCGQTFVPRQDHNSLSTCKECEAVRALIDQIVSSSKSED